MPTHLILHSLKVPDMTLVVGRGRSEPSPFSSSQRHPRGEGLQGWGGRLLLCSACGWGRGGRSAGTLSSRHLSPAACLTPFALLFLCFWGVRGYIRLHSSFREPCSRPQQGGQGESVNWARHRAPLLELEKKKKIGRQRVPNPIKKYL